MEDTYLTKLNLVDIAIDPPSLIIGAAAGALIGLLIGLLFLLWRVSKVKLKNTILSEQQARHLEDLSKYESEKTDLENQLSQNIQELVRSQTEKQAFEKQIAQNREDLEKTEKKFQLQFENLANKIFDEKTNSFKKQSKENLDTILSPLKEKLKEFQEKVDTSFGHQAKEQYALKNEIKNIVEANEKITLQAEGLTNALKGDSKIQGDWGEVMLEKILENSGLRKNEDYTLQGAGLGLSDTETGKRQKPDVIVHLPDNKHIIVDSKVSLTHYERYYSDEDDTMCATHLKQFLASVKKHVSDLKERRYQETEKLGTPDFVLMFIPIESAYMLALQEDRTLHQYAWDQGVAIVCPSTLFSTLRTISSLWRLVLQNKNAEDIAKKGGLLYDKILGFVNDMESIGKNIKTLENSYEGAMNKLSSGRGNILGRTEALKELGAKTNKSLPSSLVNSEVEENEADAKLKLLKDDDKDTSRYG